jgi:hypothetical protein
MDTADVADELDRLCQRRMLSLEDGRFRFRARILRESLADSLSPASRALPIKAISRSRRSDGGQPVRSQFSKTPARILPGPRSRTTRSIPATAAFTYCRLI